MSISLCITFLILFTSTTLVQGHDNFDMNTADNILSSSELKHILIEHNNLTHYIVVIDGHGV